MERKYLRFGDMLEQIESNKIITRTAWSKEFIYLVQGSTFEVNRKPMLGIYDMGAKIKYRKHIDMCFSLGECGMWHPTQEDIFANDYYVLPGLPIQCE